MQLSKNGHPIHNTGIRGEPCAKPMILLAVKHDTFPENEIFINANSWCEYCARNYPEWMTRTIGDISVCDGCYDHFN